MRASSRPRAVAINGAVAPPESPRLYDMYLMLDVLHVYDPLGAARVRADVFGRVVLDGPPLAELAALDKRVVATLPFAYDERVGGWRYERNPGRDDNGAEP